MTFLTSTFDIINLQGHLSAVNELIMALREGREATLTLRSEDEGAEVFPLEVSKIRLELDNTGVFRLDGETPLGRVAGHLTVTNSAGEAGRVSVATA